MFLDEELNSIYEEYKNDSNKCDYELIMACYRRNPIKQHTKPENINLTEFRNYVLRTDSSWRLFCSKHPKFKPDGFKTFFIKKFEGTCVLHLIGWDK